MSEVKTVTLELMRHGAAIGRPLGSATDYLALCGDHSPETVSIPAEHFTAFAAGLQGLRYRDSEETREQQLRQTGTLVSMIFGRIPGFLAELAAAHAACGAGGPDFVHLRLVISGPEPAHLPFELAEAPPGTPGAGRPLVLQADLPICLTRQVRRMGSHGPFQWPDRPKILLAAAAPDDAGAVPFAEHRDILEDLLEPWTRFYGDPAERRRRISEHLVTLPNASLQDIERACRKDRFTHIHLLAHGAVYRRAGFESYGVALHHADDPGRTEIVDGERLGLALGVTKVGSGPTLVTLASCDSAHSGSSQGVGSSVAHALHAVGIPMVVASQFPLSKKGAGLLVRRLYDKALWGSDLRKTLYRLRQRLRMNLPDTHDWASLVVYSHLPDDLDEILSRQRIVRAEAVAHNALDWVDRLVGWAAEEGAEGELESRLVRTLERLERAQRRLETKKETPRLNGLLAGAAKREAQALFLAADGLERLRPSPGRSNEYRRRSEKALRRARDLYRRVYEADLRQNWAIAQDLGLVVVLGDGEPRAEELWNLAKTAAGIDLGRAENRGRRPEAWALGTMIELHALAPCLPGEPSSDKLCRKVVENHARRLADLAESYPIDVYATRLQLERYGSWFRRLCKDPRFEIAATLADRALALLPDPGTPNEPEKPR